MVAHCLAFDPKCCFVGVDFEPHFLESFCRLLVGFLDVVGVDDDVDIVNVRHDHDLVVLPHQVFL